MGVAVLLLTRPQLMFTPDGNWKEFGIGKDTSHFTPFPVWLFCIVWAMASYGLAVLLVGGSHRGGRNVQVNNGLSPVVAGGYELPPGYYMLNRRAKNGVPKYVYLGPDMEGDI